MGSLRRTRSALEGEARKDPTGALASLWSALDGQVQSRWGIHSLSLESLQLHLTDEHDREIREQAFVAETFRFGWHFDPEQALSWATLQLQADCAEKVISYQVPKTDGLKCSTTAVSAIGIDIFEGRLIWEAYQG